MIDSYLPGPFPQCLVFVVRVVGQHSACAQLYSSQQLHAACKHRMPGGLGAVQRTECSTLLIFYASLTIKHVCVYMCVYECVLELHRKLESAADINFKQKEER